MNEHTEHHESKESMMDDRIDDNDCWRCDALHDEVNKQNDEIERLSNREGKARMEISYNDGDNPFARSRLKVVDFSVSDNFYVCESELVDSQHEEIERLKQGICEHVGQDVIGSDCYLCEAAIAMKGYPKWVEKAKVLREENARLGKCNKSQASLISEFEGWCAGKDEDAEELKAEIADLRSIEKEHNHTIDVLETEHKQLKELDNYNGMLEIGMALTEKDGQIDSLESKVKEMEEENIRVHKACNKRAVERDNLRDRVKELETDLKLNAHMLATKCDLHMEGLSKIRELEEEKDTFIDKSFDRITLKSKVRELEEWKEKIGKKYEYLNGQYEKASNLSSSLESKLKVCVEALEEIKNGFWDNGANMSREALKRCAKDILKQISEAKGDSGKGGE